MNRCVILILVITSIFSPQLLCAQVPLNPNKKDTQGRRQGTWTILFSSNWKQVLSKDSMAYYRLLVYKDDKPQGITRDYYATGKIQFEGKLLEDRPNAILYGTVSYFSEEGIKEMEGEVENNQWKSYKIYADDGTIINEDDRQLDSIGSLAFKKSDFKKALSYFKKSAVAAKYRYGEGTDKYGIHIMHAAGSYEKLGDMESAGRLAQKVITIYRDLGDADNANVGIVEQIIGNQFLKLEKFDLAETSYRRTLFIEEKVYGKTRAHYILKLRNLATCLQKSKQCEKAIPFFKEAREMQASSVGKENDTYVSLTLRLETCLFLTKSYREAKPILEELRLLTLNKPAYSEVYNAIIGPWSKIDGLIAEQESPKTGAKDDMIAGIKQRLAGNYDDAIATLQRVIKERGGSFGNKSSEVAEAMQELGFVYVNLAQYKKATDLLEKSTAMYEAVEGKKSIHVALGLSNQGVAWLMWGQLNKAEPLLNTAYESGLPFLQANPKEFSQIEINLSNFYLQVNNFAKAEPLLKEALELRKKLFGASSYATAETLDDLGKVYYAQGDLKKAEATFKETLAILEKAVGTESPLYASVQKNLATIYRDQGQGNQSFDLLLKALVTKLGAFDSKHPEYAFTVNEIGLVYLMSGDFKKAEGSFALAEEVLRKANCKKHPSYSIVLNNLAMAKERVLKSDEAEKYYLQSLDLTYQQIREVFPALSEAEKKKYYDEKNYLFENFGNFAVTDSRKKTYQTMRAAYAQMTDKEFKEYFGNLVYTNQDKINYERRIGYWYNMRLATKGLLFHASVQMRERIMNSGDKTLINLFSKWQQFRDSLTRAYQRPSVTTTKLEEEIGQLEKELSKRSEAFRKSSDNRTYTWTDVQKMLKPGEAAVEIIRLNKREEKMGIDVKDEVPKEKVIGHYYHAAYVALIVKYDTEDHPELVLINDGQAMEEKHVRYYRNAIRFNIRDDSSYHIFWKPIGKTLEGIKKLYFSPDGAYHLINLNTLMNTDRTKNSSPVYYLNDDIEIETVLSTKDVIANTQSTQKSEKAYLFGYPNYNNQKTSATDTTRGLAFNAIPTSREIKNDTSQRFFSGADITELPGTKTEVENIQKILSNKSIQTTAFLYDNASETQIKKIADPPILHIATHGYFLADTRKSELPNQTAPIINHPLLRSGLLFCGAKFAFQDYNSASSGNDGVLTAMEATGLHLDHTQLVVLSACETGLGVISNGEGVYGLQRAFQLAGAKAVLMSLWTVPDQATQELMTTFYSKWMEGISMRQAFNEAQRQLRAKYPNPHDWGGFVLIGN